MRIDRTVIAPYAAADMYALVDDIAAYPEFLPWCTGAEVRRDGEKVWARLNIRYAGFSTAFATRNLHTPAQRIHMELAEGPLASLAGVWEFTEIESRRSRVQFNLHYEFSNRLMGLALKKIFAHVFDNFVDHFMTRAHAQHRHLRVEVVQAANVGSGAGAQTLHLPPGATVADALAAANLSADAAVSVYGKVCGMDTPLSGGERIEINQPLPAAPAEMRRQRQ